MADLLSNRQQVGWVLARVLSAHAWNDMRNLITRRRVLTGTPAILVAPQLKLLHQVFQRARRRIVLERPPLGRIGKNSGGSCGGI